MPSHPAGVQSVGRILDQPADQASDGAASDRPVLPAPTSSPEDGGYLTVPWSVLADYHCFGCSPHNPHGLRLRFAARDDAGIETRFRLGRGYESYPGIVHGGLIGVICDETMGNLLVLRAGHTALTTGMRLRYVSSLRIDAEYRCVAHLSGGPGGASSGSGLVRAEAEILDAEGGLAASASATYRPISMASARERMDLRPEEFDQVEAAIAATAAQGEPR
ncbi:Thioesterase superfamily [Frankia sp. AiPs1]|uniref:PaaI family thioesterase n=1 Tax=Frankia sp. AiPa1 TaxID=573492 RepID=UPI00202AC829|nr:PaaI family thioesterase [Frankia sp. AiPa1]MCL9758917.1 PaaI family thioesterase [Frankia sp. AiPa1]